MRRPYRESNQHNAVTHFAIGLDRITVWFAGSERPYTYSHASASEFTVAAMKRLALQGSGLSHYIQRYAKTRHIPHGTQSKCFRIVIR